MFSHFFTNHHTLCSVISSQIITPYVRPFLPKSSYPMFSHFFTNHYTLCSVIFSQIIAPYAQSFLHKSSHPMFNLSFKNHNTLCSICKIQHWFLALTTGRKYDINQCFQKQLPLPVSAAIRTSPPPRMRGMASAYKMETFVTVLRIRIHMFLGLLDPDPDPLVRGMDPGPSIIKQKQLEKP